VGDAEPTSVYVVVTVELPAVDVTVTVPGTLIPVATSSRRPSQ
jgi:multidrug efflux pump subunit AcrA (membrane-fusion protein)